jgi:phage-related protein
MNQDEIGPQWQKLCEEHEAAREAYFRAFAAINQKFVAIGKKTSNVNPTVAELTEFETTRHAWQDVIRRMGEFVKKHV